MINIIHLTSTHFKKVLITILLIIIVSFEVNAAVNPPDPGGDPAAGGGTPVGGGAPIGNGVYILLSAASVYSLLKLKTKPLKENDSHKV